MHSNVTSTNVSWPHFSWTTLYMEIRSLCSFSLLALCLILKHLHIPQQTVTLQPNLSFYDLRSKLSDGPILIINYNNKNSYLQRSMLKTQVQHMLGQ